MTRGKREKESTSNVVSKIHTDGRVEEINRPMTLSEMQEFVGGSPLTYSLALGLCWSSNLNPSSFTIRAR